MINDDCYKHSDELMHLSKFKGCKNREALSKYFYDSSFADASKLSATLVWLFGLNVSLPVELNEMIVKEMYFFIMLGCILMEKITISLDHIEKCCDILTNAIHRCIYAVKQKLLARFDNN
ncbi:hypothetical protein [Phytobacter diazotrophicus]